LRPHASHFYAVVRYTKSTMSFFEFYAMGLPLFVPSVRLPARWDLAKLLPLAARFVAHRDYAITILRPGAPALSR